MDEKVKKRTELKAEAEMLAKKALEAAYEEPFALKAARAKAAADSALARHRKSEGQ